MRRAKALSQEDVAHRIGKDRTSISRYETGEMTPGVSACRALAQLYEVPLDKLWEAIEGNGATPNVSTGWWTNYEAFEQSAVSVRTWEPMVVPGLLQTPAYAEALLGDDDLVARRLDRQGMLTRTVDPVDLVAIIDASVLARPVGGRAVLAAQLDHLTEMARRPNVCIQVLPHDAPTKAIAIGCRGAFVILGLPWPGGMVHLEHTGGARTLDAQHELEAHSDAYDRLRSMALPPAESLALIRSAAQEARR